MIEVLNIFLKSGLFFTICYLTNIITKCVVAYIITHNNNLSDTEVKFLTQMMSKDIHIRK